MTASICFPGQGQWRWWTVKGAYKWTATHGENHPTFDVYCTGTVLCETAVHTKYSWYVCMWYLLPLGGGAVWRSRNAVKKETLCACVCVCALSRWTYSRSGCLSELRPDRCGSNLRPYDVIDYLIFWRPTHRPPLGLMDTHTKTHRTTVSSFKHKNKSRLVLLGTRLDSLSNRVRKDDGSRKCSLIPSFMCEMLICVCCFLKLAFPRSSGCAIFLSVLPPLMSACVLM